MRPLANVLLGAVIATTGIHYPVEVNAQVALRITGNQSSSIQSVIGPELLSGQRPGATIGMPALVLAVRPQAVVQCVAEQAPNEVTGKRVTFDHNGYFAPSPLLVDGSLLDASGRYRGTLAVQSLVVGGEVLRYSQGDYLPVAVGGAVSPVIASDARGSVGLTLSVSGVQGYCYLMAQDDATPVAPDCITEEVADTVFTGRFDPLSAGAVNLAAWSQVVQPAGNIVRYTYTMRAVGGPVYDIALREQFPFFSDADSGAPTFGRSLGLDEAWSCSASSGGHCDARQGRTASGLGYVRVTGGHLAHEGACLSLSAERGLRSDGVHHESPFSNRLHVGVLYRQAPDASGPGVRQLATRRIPFSP